MKRRCANTPLAKSVDQLFEVYGGRRVLEAVADYARCHLGLECFATPFERAAAVLPASRIPSAAAELLDKAEDLGGVA
jgi:hypothetical protein